jgi:putative spermidine/putrescine transport system ATP-binding protein
LRSAEAGYAVDCEGGGAIALAQAAPCSRAGSVVLAARPEHLVLADSAVGALPARVEMVLPLGPSLVYELALATGGTIKVTQPRSAGQLRYATGDRVGVRLRPGAPAGVFAN